MDHTAHDHPGRRSWCGWKSESLPGALELLRIDQNIVLSRQKHQKYQRVCLFPRFGATQNRKQFPRKWSRHVSGSPAGAGARVARFSAGEPPATGAALTRVPPAGRINVFRTACPNSKFDDKEEVDDEDILLFISYFFAILFYEEEEDEHILLFIDANLF
jgi:hypothetical protein